MLDYIIKFMGTYATIGLITSLAVVLYYVKNPPKKLVQRQKEQLEKSKKLIEENENDLSHPRLFKLVPKLFNYAVPAVVTIVAVTSIWPLVWIVIIFKLKAWLP